MPPRVVGPSAASASSSPSEVRRAQEQTPPPSSSSSSFQPKLLSGGNDWFLSASQRDNQILTLALTRELSSCKDPASSSSKSLAETLSRCLEGRASWQSKNSEALCVPRTLQQQEQKQAMPSGLHQQNTVDGSLPQQKIFSQKESPLSSNSTSPMSVSKEKLESPFNTSSLSANSTMSKPNTIATDSFVTQQHQIHTNAHLQDAQMGLFGNTISSLRASFKPEEAPNLADNLLFSSKTASMALSSQASAGAGGAKVSKRRSRANKKAPIAVLSADTSNFRAMVQQLTGIPTSPSIQQYGSHIWGSPGVPLLKPHPTRPFYNGTLSLPTLDTSASFLGPKSTPIKGPLQDFSYVQRSHQPLSSPLLGANFSADLGFSKGRGTNNMLQGSLPHDFKYFLPNHQANPINYDTSSISLPRLWDSIDSGKLRGNYPSYKEDLKQASSQGMMREADQFIVRQAPTALESFLVAEDLHAKSSYNAVDSWLAFDGALATHSPKVELARMA